MSFSFILKSFWYCFMYIYSYILCTIITYIWIHILIIDRQSNTLHVGLTWAKVQIKSENHFFFWDYFRSLHNLPYKLNNLKCFCYMRLYDNASKGQQNTPLSEEKTAYKKHILFLQSLQLLLRSYTESFQTFYPSHHISGAIIKLLFSLIKGSRESGN